MHKTILLNPSELSGQTPKLHPKDLLKESSIYKRRALSGASADFTQQNANASTNPPRRPIADRLTRATGDSQSMARTNASVRSSPRCEGSETFSPAATHPPHPTRPLKSQAPTAGRTRRCAHVFNATAGTQLDVNRQSDALLRSPCALRPPIPRFIHTYIHIYMHIIHTYMHTCIHTYIHIFIHIQVRPGLRHRRRGPADRRGGPPTRRRGPRPCVAGAGAPTPLLHPPRPSSRRQGRDNRGLGPL